MDYEYSYALADDATPYSLEEGNNVCCRLPGYFATHQASNATQGKYEVARLNEAFKMGRRHGFPKEAQEISKDYELWAGTCRDPKGKYDQENKPFWRRCPCRACGMRRNRKQQERQCEEDRLQAKWEARRNRAVASGVSFLIPTFGQRAWSWLKLLAACAGSVAVSKVVEGWL